jgi:hypothetical protein
MKTQKNGDKRLKRYILDNKLHLDFLFKEVSQLGTMRISEYCSSAEPLPDDVRNKFLEAICHKVIKRAKSD